jgi:hypothetical protein
VVAGIRGCIQLAVRAEPFQARGVDTAIYRRENLSVCKGKWNKAAPTKF